ncbi:hypothetical protein [Thermococcus sp.]
MRRLLSSLAFAGVGITISFVLIVMSFHPSTSMDTLIPVYLVGLLGGAFYGAIGKRGGVNASGVAFILGLTITVLLNLLWRYRPLTLGYSIAFLVIVIVGMFMVESKSDLDIALIPFSYFGGFIVGMLLFMNVHLAEVEGAVMSVMVTGVIGAFVSLVVALLRVMFNLRKQKNVELLR